MGLSYFKYWIPACLASMAFVTSAVYSFWCQSFKFEAKSPSSETPTIQFGPWYHQQTQLVSVGIGNSNSYYVVQNTCVEIDSNLPVDSHGKTARAFSVITLVLGGFMTIGLWFAPCFSRYANSGTWSSMACTFMTVVTLFQGLTFLFLKSSMCTSNQLLAGTPYENECQWDSGSTTNVVSVCLWFFTGVSMMALGAPKRDPRPPPESQTVTYEQYQHADGTATFAEAQVVKGVAVPQPADSPAV